MFKSNLNTLTELRFMHKIPGKIFRIAKATKSSNQKDDYPIITCPKCENLINKNSNFCKFCGHELS